MELNIHDIIKGVVFTSKSTQCYAKLGKITFHVHTKANKIMVKKAVEKIWDVKVDSVRVIALPGKVRRFKGNRFYTGSKKKAIITLKKGFKIDLPGHTDASEVGMSDNNHTKG